MTDTSIPPDKEKRKFSDNESWIDEINTLFLIFCTLLTLALIIRFSEQAEAILAAFVIIGGTIAFLYALRQSDNKLYQIIAHAITLKFATVLFGLVFIGEVALLGWSFVDPKSAYEFFNPTPTPESTAIMVSTTSTPEGASPLVLGIDGRVTQLPFMGGNLNPQSLFASDEDSETSETPKPEDTPSPRSTTPPTATEVLTATQSSTPSLAPTYTLTTSPTLTSTGTPTASATVTLTPSSVPTETFTRTPTPSHTSTATDTPTPSVTPTITHTVTNTATVTPLATPTPTSTLIPTTCELVDVAEPSGVWDINDQSFIGEATRTSIALQALFDQNHDNVLDQAESAAAWTTIRICAQRHNTP